MTTATDDISPIPNSALRRASIVLFAALLPFLLALALSGLFHLFGDYKVTARVPASTEYASITYPERNKPVEQSFVAKGIIKKLPANTTAYLMIKRDELYWPKKHLGNGLGKWSQKLRENKRRDSKLYLVILALNPTDKLLIDEWHSTSQKTHKYPGITQFSIEQEIATIEVKQK